MTAEAPIYLDHNATTPVLPEVVEVIRESLVRDFGNPSSGHPYGRRAQATLGHAREQVAALIGSAPDEVLFTSGGTEANNLAIRGAADASLDRRGIVTSRIEHPATREPCRALESAGWKLTWVPVDETGRTIVEELRAAVGGETALVTLMHANNEVGTLQPVQEAAVAAHASGALVHNDAAQSVGKVPVRVDELGVDLLSIAGHKLYAPKGVGALYVRRGTPLRPVLLGAGHEYGLRPGTENVASIAGLGMACEIARRTLADEIGRVRDLRDRLGGRLKEQVPGLRLHGHPTDRLPNTLNVGFPNVRGNALLDRAPELAASTGSACHEGGESPSEVLLAMGLGESDALGAVRLSLGRSTRERDVDEAAAALVRAWRALRHPLP